MYSSDDPREIYWDSRNQTSFGRPRFANGERRFHGGVDLVAPAGTPVLAMADGVVLRITGFYEGTDVIEVKHPGVGIVRYGEVEHLGVENVFIRPNARVRKGQVIGHVGKRKGAARYMLHLELYSDESDWLVDVAGHKLSQKGVRTYENLPQKYAHTNFERRHDLVDPTNFLRSAPLARLQNVQLYPPDRRPAERSRSLSALLGRSIRVVEPFNPVTKENK